MLQGTTGRGPGDEETVPAAPLVPPASAEPAGRRSTAPGEHVPSHEIGTAGPADAPGATRRLLASPRAPRLRTGLALSLVVAASLGMLVSVITLWVRDVAGDTDAYVGVVAAAGEDPEVRAAVASYAAAQVVQTARLGGRIRAAMPSGATLTVPFLTRAALQYLAAQIEQFLATPAAQRLWARGNRFAHQQLVSGMRSGDRSAAGARGDVRLDLLPLVIIALQRTRPGIPGIFGEAVRLPPLDPATPPGDARTQLRDALGRRLPADLAAVTLLHGEVARDTERALGLADDLAVPATAVTVALVAAALLVSVRRRQTVLWLGAGALCAAVTARVVEAQLQKATAASALSGAGATVARAVLTSTLASLNGYAAWLAAAGAIVCVAAFLAGRPAWPVAMSRNFAMLFGVASDLSTPETRVGRWIGAHLGALGIAGAVVAVATLPFASGSAPGVVALVLALVVFELVLAVYAAGVPGKAATPESGAPPSGDPGAPAAG
jgi:hypothetical protein